VTRFLVDKPGGKLTHGDMLLAKKIIKFKCLVGLYEDMEVSMARFQRYFGWDARDASPEQKAEVVKCRSLAVARGDKNAMHPDGSAVREGSIAWNAIVRMNVFDMELYEYVKKIYKVQGEQIFDVVGSHNSAPRSPGNDVGEDLVNDEQLTGTRSGSKSMGAEFEPRSGKSMAVDAFEEEVFEPRSGKSMAADTFEDEVFGPRSGKIMDTDAFEDEVFEPRAGHMADAVEDESTDPYAGDLTLDAAEEDEPATTPDSDNLEIDPKVRNYCQLIYVLGVEGVGHHGFAPIMTELFERQMDQYPGVRYERLTQDNHLVQRAFYGRKGSETDIDDPTLVKKLIHKACPNDGAKHVVVLGTSFPSKGYDSHYRVNRQRDWATMSMEEMANSETALNHPINLRSFYNTYSPYADIKFVVLHRPFIDTIASHMGFDGGPEKHLNVISGYLLLIRRFLDELPLDETGNSAWTLVCMQHLTNKFYKGDTAQLNTARQTVLSNLVNFLGWPQNQCDDCFNQWLDSKTLDPEAQLYNRGVEMGIPQILDTMERTKVALDGIWPPMPPPPLGGGAVAEEQQCSL